MELKAFEDPSHIGNSAQYRTGKVCIENGCHNLAGTAWSPYWCFSCNVKRMKKITQQFLELARVVHG